MKGTNQNVSVALLLKGAMAKPCSPCQGRNAATSVPELSAVSQADRELYNHPAITRELRYQREFITTAREELWEYIDYIVDLHERLFRWSWTSPLTSRSRWAQELRRRSLRDLRPIRNEF